MVSLYLIDWDCYHKENMPTIEDPSFTLTLNEGHVLNDATISAIG